MLLSAIVLCCDSGRHIGAALRSLAADCGRLAAPCEILVVDNGSRDESPTLLAQLAAELGGLLRVIRLPRNMGTSVARNVALRTARGRAILIMDSDAVVPAGCLGALLARLDAAPQAGLVAPRLVHADGRPQLSADIFPPCPASCGASPVCGAWSARCRRRTARCGGSTTPSRHSGCCRARRSRASACSTNASPTRPKTPITASGSGPRAWRCSRTGPWWRSTTRAKPRADCDRVWRCGTSPGSPRCSASTATCLEPPACTGAWG
jgi:glycosyltransferase involved in cell wall biosynthesis